MSNARILVVDDSELFRKECIDMLRKSGEPWEVIEAPGGAEGIKAVSSRDVDIILLDINMPDIDGFRFLAIVEDKFPNIPVIVVTARRERKDITRCMELGAVDFIEKPFYQEDLVARVRARLRDKTRVDTLKSQVAVRRKKSRPSEGEAP
ncbi:MAG: response regulator [Nitrospirae bacterium]|nr:response regulator [Nitrospirota bacterium]